ncbi:cation channel sperm-associated protein 2 isoform X2 [Mesocricetus auratus]|uniref:Cation channel sperm-associated protein 2 isoform X2 n=1 Tax=Mesocricetus auratus TaxID=10036 RepID=A0ABM2XH62_MESAU|nr:cation channel sperm-associated protein 2 isoform X2 [Mesocricetus auratus]
MAQEQGHMHLPRADAIRSRLVDTFSLIEHLQGLSQAVPRHTLREILDPSRQKKLMSGDQHQLVRFSIKPRHMGHITHSQRMLSSLRVRCSQRPPLSLWAGWVLESSIFSKFIISLIFLNTIVLMVEIELMESTNTKLWPLKLTLESVLPEFVVLMGVSGESVWLQLLRISRVLRSLKLFARFRQIKVIILALVRALKSMTFLLMLLLIFFYIFAVTGVYFFEDYSRSTIEDLEYSMFFSDLLNSLVTVFILFTLDHWYAVLQDVWKVPEASRVFSSIYVVLWLLLGSIIFRNIIVAMMVTNFQNIRNELNEEMTHLEVQYKADIFKRQIIQRRHNLSPEAGRETSHRKASQDLLEPSKGSELSDAEKSDAETSDAETSDAEGSDAKRSDAEESGAERSGAERSGAEKRDADTSDADINDADINDAEQAKAGEGQKKSSKSKDYSSSSSTSSSSSYSSFLVDFDYDGKLDWETLVHENLPGLMDIDQDDRVVWPRDSLFRYFELLEKLQYNLEERKKLQEFAVQALMSFEDK